MVHLSSAPGEKFKGRKIGGSHPILPYEVSPVKTIPESFKGDVPHYSTNFNLFKKNKNVNPHEENLAETVAIYKDENSLKKLRNASKLAAEMLYEAKKIVTQFDSMKDQDLTTDAIDSAIHEKILERGGYPSPLNYNGFPKSICTSVNEIACHGIPNLRPLQFGDLISIDVSVYLDGFHGDSCASFIVGADAPNYGEIISHNDELINQIERMNRLIEATKEARKNAIDVCIAGNTISAIGHAVQEVANAYEFRPMKNVYGHGVGRHLHMLPRIKHFKNKDDVILEEGMALTIEPVLVEGHHAHSLWSDSWTNSTVDGGFACQFEHTVLIKEYGPAEILTKLQE
ncbi:methionyl aminopeptidase [Chaetoceros tenuissimus]|uniref:Methionine aminopeptidase n=1 Tax=Chaetoceros tenuissimus TaxID=426638 RepID=A0AAD3CJF2_9STRA|nr:methionyl aminopeptidase [Chaetoceros tenuissimus]